MVRWRYVPDGFGPDVDRAERLVKARFADSAETQPAAGLIPAHFYVSADGSRVFNYALWTSAQAHQNAARDCISSPANLPQPLLADSVTESQGGPHRPLSTARSHSSPGKRPSWSDVEFGREAGPAQLCGQVSHVVVEEHGGRPAGCVSDDRQGRVAVVEAHPPPLGSVEGGSDQPADEEVVRDNQLMAGETVVDRTREFCECFPGQRWTTVALLFRNLSEEAEHGVGRIRRQLLLRRQVGDVVAGQFRLVQWDGVKLCADQLGRLLRPRQRPVVDRRKWGALEPFTEQNGLAPAAFRQGRLIF